MTLIGGFSIDLRSCGEAGSSSSTFENYVFSKPLESVYQFVCMVMVMVMGRHT